MTGVTLTREVSGSRCVPVSERGVRRCNLSHCDPLDLMTITRLIVTIHFLPAGQITLLQARPDDTTRQAGRQAELILCMGIKNVKQELNRDSQAVGQLGSRAAWPTCQEETDEDWSLTEKLSSISGRFGQERLVWSAVLAPPPPCGLSVWSLR